MTRFVINLERRKDRLEQLNLPFGFFRIEAIDGSIFTDLPMKIRSHNGCRLSHIKTLEYIKKFKYESALIFEDDVVLCKDFDNKFEKVLTELPEDWDLLYLGSWNVGDIKKYSESLNIAETVYCTHGYMIKDKFIDTVLESLKSRIWKVDVLLSEALSKGKCYVASPVLCWQAPGFSDIENKNTNNKHLM